jgi:hypothetical protein
MVSTAIGFAISGSDIRTLLIVPFGISIQEAPQKRQAFLAVLFDCAVVFNLGTFYRRDIRRGFASVLLLRPLGAHFVSCILVFSQSYIRTQRSEVSKRLIFVSPD